MVVAVRKKMMVAVRKKMMVAVREKMMVAVRKKMMVAMRKKMTYRVKTQAEAMKGVKRHVTGKLQVQWAQGHQGTWERMQVEVVVKMVA